MYRIAPREGKPDDIFLLKGLYWLLDTPSTMPQSVAAGAEDLRKCCKLAAHIASERQRTVRRHNEGRQRYGTPALRRVWVPAQCEWGGL